MKPRQIKKNSKSAMDLLIKFFGYKPSDFALEEQPTNKNKRYDKRDYFEWHCYGEPSYEYGECDSQVANDELYDAVSYKSIKLSSAKYSDWVTEEFTLKDHFMSISKIDLIRECRKLAKAGVRFK